ncbi:MAG: hypothetical protein ACOC6N_04830 [archaeon]
MEIESEIREIKDLLHELNAKLDIIMDEREGNALMKLSETALKDFFDKEPVLYSINDVKVRYS